MELCLHSPSTSSCRGTYLSTGTNLSLYFTFVFVEAYYIFLTDIPSSCS